MNPSPLRIASPSDFIELMPFLLGHTPENSLVLHGIVNSGTAGPTMTVPLPTDPTHWHAVAEAAAPNSSLPPESAATTCWTSWSASTATPARPQPRGDRSPPRPHGRLDRRRLHRTRRRPRQARPRHRWRQVVGLHLRLARLLRRRTTARKRPPRASPPDSALSAAYPAAPAARSPASTDHPHQRGPLPARPP